MGTVRAAVVLRAPAAVAACSLLLAACSPGPEPSLTLDDAPAHYESVLDDVETAFDGVVGDVGWTTDGPGLAEAAEDGLCTYWSPRREAAHELDVAATGARWADVVAAVRPVVTDHGFEVVEDGAVEGGWLVVHAEDAAGAVLRLEFKSRTELDVSGALVRPGATGCALP